jgi:hypothetical protein
LEKTFAISNEYMDVLFVHGCGNGNASAAIEEYQR